MNNIYLVGFMGTGKSAAGRNLAARLDREFVEMDARIEEQAQMTISDIFSRKGESFFRSLEQSLLEDLSRQNTIVVSCGGGIVVNPVNIQCMKESGTMVCLTATAESIYERIKRSTHRPLLQVADPLSRIRVLLAEREALYRQASFCVDTTPLSEAQVVDRIIAVLQKENRV